jgi:hypothetical protein
MKFYAEDVAVLKDLLLRCRVVTWSLAPAATPSGTRVCCPPERTSTRWTPSPFPRRPPSSLRASSSRGVCYFLKACLLHRYIVHARHTSKMLGVNFVTSS